MMIICIVDATLRKWTQLWPVLVCEPNHGRSSAVNIRVILYILYVIICFYFIIYIASTFYTKA